MSKRLSDKINVTSHAFGLGIEKYMFADSFRNFIPHHCLLHKHPVYQRPINSHYHIVMPAGLTRITDETG